MTKGAAIMKKICFIIVFVLLVTVLSSSCAASYTSLPEKMSKQLQAGSWLYGSFVIHGNASPVLKPVLSVLQNAEYGIAGFKTEKNLQCQVFQKAEPGNVKVIAELLRPEQDYFLRSDFLDSIYYKLPDTDQMVNSSLDIHGENQPVFSKLLKLIAFEKAGDENTDIAESLEKQLELWISGFTPVTTIRKDDQSVPSLSEVFTIPVESMYNMITEMIQYISRNDSVMSYLRSSLSEEEIFLYFNPDLSYYYLEALENLNLKGNIVFSRTVSTMGEILENSLLLPLDEGKTGYSLVTLRNDAKCKSIQLSGLKGIIFLELPAGLDFKEKEYETSVRFARISPESSENKNLSILANINKTHESYQKEENDTIYDNEIDIYKIHIERDTSVLPEGTSPESIPEMTPVQADAELHYYSDSTSSKKPTKLDFSFRVFQGEYNCEVTGAVTTASPKYIADNYPWISTTFDENTSIQPMGQSMDEFRELLNKWMANASGAIIHTPEEISPAPAE